MNTIQRIDDWVNTNFWKYHLITKVPLIIITLIIWTLIKVQWPQKVTTGPVSIMMTALLKNYPRERNKKNQIKPASGPRPSAIDKGRSRATLDVTSLTSYVGLCLKNGFYIQWWFCRIFIAPTELARKRIHSFKNKSRRQAKTSIFLWDSCYTSMQLTLITKRRKYYGAKRNQILWIL